MQLHQQRGDGGWQRRTLTTPLMPDEEAEEAREGLVEEKGFFILPSELFCNVLGHGLPEDENSERDAGALCSGTLRSPRRVALRKGALAGLFDDFDVNSNKLGATVAKRNEKLVKLLTRRVRP